MKKSSKIGIILLAAGASSRLGEAKQSLVFAGETLLRRAVKNALDANAASVLVVLGARAAVLKNDLQDFAVATVENKDWKTGMSGSIKIGLEKLLETETEMRAIILTVCDQPFVDADLLDRLVETHENTDAPIVASRYAETLGVPALFAKSLFSQLLGLEGKGGAKKLIERFKPETAIVEFPEGAFDIDTPEDFLKLQNRKS